MSCDDTYKLISELLDGQCDHERYIILRKQIESCPECFRRLGIEEEVRALVRGCCSRTRAPENLRVRIFSQLNVHYEVRDGE